ncbi:hypothetical protein JQK15_13640 [Sphingobium sp. BHU LFT2]|uniref:DUF7359 domain-containing protein n=1 Tax=Sphingobium sp. BHU LFT2 TaxID=2807634 RepID=UPI001BE77F87|nr:hypothetical protein [Sphingobium sp. BHU LFT2]MBT2244582.1 hypothetical protein [Sphingobium sp. BHU LFT2]
MTNNILIEATPYNPATSSFVTVRMTLMGADDRGTQLNGYQWMPCINGTPITTRRFASDGVAQSFEGNGGEVGFVCAPQFGNQDWATLQWDGATFSMFVAPIGAPWAEYRQVLSGTTSAIKREGAQCSINLSGSEATLNRNLLTASYAGTGNAEGPSELKGTLKPFAAGDCLNIEPILIDPVRFIYQFHNGAAQDVTAVYEQALTLGPASTTASTYNSLRDATLQPGEWIKAPAIGCFRLGAEPTGKITADIKGGKDGSTYPASIATIVPLLIKAAGVPAAKIKTASFAAFSAVPWSYYTKAQVQIGDVARDALQQAGGYLMADGQGNWQVGNYYATSTATALREDRSALPLVRSIVQNEAAPPVYRVRVGYNRCWAVHSADEISPALSEAQDDIIAAKEAADAAKAAADAAQADADQALQQIDNIGADGILDRAEKAIIVREFQQVTAEKAGIESRATGAGITTLLTAYTNAYNTLSSYLSGLSPAYTDTTQNTSITRSTWNSRWNGYYTARQALLNEIARLAADMVGSLPATTVASAVTNFNTRNDRNASPVTAPTLLTDGTAITSTANTDGSADIRFAWNWAGSNDDIDGFRVIVRSSLSSSAYTLGGTVGEEQAFELPADRRAFSLYGTAADRYYTFYVQAYRVVDPDVASGGLIVSTAVKSTRSGANPYQPSATVNFIGKVGGVDAAALVAQAAAAKPIDTVAPNQVTGLTVTSTAAFDAVGGQIITLNIGWTASTAADLAGYSIEIAQGASSTTFIPVGNVGKTATTYAYSAGILANTVYRVRVAAYDDSANLGNWSAIFNVTTARDTAAPSAPTGMVAEAQALDAIQINWTNPSASDLDRIEIYEHTANSSSAATKIMTVNGSAGQIGGYRRSGLPASALRYYWTKAVDTSGNASGFSAVVSATVSKGAGLDVFDPTLGVKIPQGVTSLPNVATWTGSNQVWVDGTLYELKAGAWVKAIDMAGISGKVVEAQISTGAVTSDKIGTNEVKTTNIAPLAVTAAEMANLTISNGKLANSAVDANKLATNAVIEAKIAQGAVTVNKVGDGAITTAKLFDGAVNSDKLAGGSVLEDKIGLEAVTAAKIGPNAVTVDKLAANSVTASKLVVADVSNYVQDPTFSDEAYWALTRGTFSTDSAAINAMAVPKAFRTDVGNGTTSQADSRIATQASQRYSIEGGASYRLNGTWYVTAGFTGLIQIVIYWYKADGSGASTSSQTLTLADYRSTAAAAAANGTNNAIAKAPTDSVFAKFDYKVVWSTSVNNAGYGYVAYPILNRAASGELIVDGAITATKIATNSIDATKVAAGSITASKLLIGDTSNMVTDANCVDPSYWTAPGGVSTGPTGSVAASTNRLWAASSTTAYNIASSYIPVEPNKEYYASLGIGLNSGTATVTAKVDWYSLNVSGVYAYISSSTIGAPVTSGTLSRVSAIVTAPATARACMILASKAASAAAASPTLMEPVMRRASSGELIVDGAITATKVAASAITADKVAAGAITATKVFIGDTSNMVPDPGFNDQASWTGAAYTLSTTTSAFASDYYLRILSNAAAPQQVRSTAIPVEKSTAYAFSGIPFTSTSNTATATISVEWYSDIAATALISTAVIGSGTGTGQTATNMIATAPANARRAKILLARSAGNSDTGEARFANIVMRRAASGELIVDGAITADKISANAIDATKVAAGAITASKLLVGDTSNMFGDPDLVDRTYTDWVLTHGLTFTGTGLVSSSTNRANMTSSADLVDARSPLIAVERDKDYFVSSQVSADGAGATLRLYVEWYSMTSGGATTWLSSATVGTIDATTTNTVYTLSGIVTAPASARRMRMLWRKEATSAAMAMSFYGPVVRRATSGELIVDGAITADKIAAKSIIASKVAIGDTSNMVADPNMSDLACWRGNTVTTGLAVGTYTSTNFLAAASSTDRLEFGSTPIQIEAGKDYYVSAGVRNSGNSIPTLFVINWYSDSAATAYISNSLIGTNSTGSFFPLLSTIVTAPANARVATMQFIKDVSSTASGLQAVSPIFRRASSGELIVDGSIVASKIAVGAVSANKMSVVAGGNIEDNRLPTGLYVGTSGDTIGTVQTQASGAFDGTAGYRVTGVPTNTPTPSSASVFANANGTRNITLNWAAYTQGTRKADFLMIFWRKATTAPGLNDSAVSVNVNTSAASYYIFEGVSPNDTFSFGIAAARRTENGIEIGAIQTIAGWTNLATATANFTGNIAGTSAATIRANALNPASVINAAATTIDPGKITITGTTTLADWRYGNTTTIDGGYIATNTITANAIAANTITANKLVIGDTTNIVDNGWSNGILDSWTTQNVTNFSQDNTAGAAAGWRIQSIGRDQAVSAAVSVTPGESYYMQAWCFNRHAGRANIYAFGTADLTLSGTVTITSVGWTDTKTAWTKVSGIYTVPSGVTALRMCLQSERTAGSGDPTFWGKPVLRPAASGELIVDGAITASKIKAGEIISDHIIAGTLAGDRIAGRSIGADRLVAGSISVNEMGANSISANQLQANAVTADKIKAGEITGDKINSATSLPGSLTISGTGFSLGTINNAIANTGQLNTYNGDFSAWAGTLPDGFNSWGGSGTATKVTGERGGKSVRITATANGQNGMVQTGDNGTNAGNYALYAGRWIVIEADITLNSGNLQGAGILVRAQGGADTYLRFASDPEVWGGVAGNGSAGQTYSFRKLVATTAGSSTRPEMYLMNHYGGIGSMATANDITWHHAGWRYASDGEYNPAAQVNAASTQIDPGKILISGSTSLASWRNGGDNTKIEGGSIAANTITANKLTLGNRNIGFIGFNFEWNPTLNRVEWSNGFIYWYDDNNNQVATAVAAGSTGSAVAHQFIYWSKGATTFSYTQNQGLMMSDNAIQVAAWWGGNQLNVNYGGTIMHGDRITTGTIQANRLSVGQLSAITADMGTVFAGMIRNNAGSTQFDVTNGRIIFNNGSVMKVSGSGFGTNNQFIEWFGPALSNINQCSESNATSYLRNDGSAYFGGALLAGTLRNTNATSVLTNNASTTIGPFGSNGNQIVVNASWSWSSVNRADYPANATGRNNYNSAISTLQSQGYTIVDDGGGSGHTGYKSDNKDGSQFALTLVKNGGQAASEGGCTGYIGLFGVRPEPADGQPGFIEYTYTYSKSLTYTDPERSTAQRTFTASITRNFTPSGTANQRVVVNTVE